MNPVILRLTAIWLSLLVGSSLPAQQQEKQAQEPTKVEWPAKIIEATQPSTVAIEEQIFEPFGGVTVTKTDERPPQNQVWLVLSVELTPPDARASLPLTQIRIIDETSAVYSLVALTSPISTERTSGNPSFFYWKPPRLFFIVSESKVKWEIGKGELTSPQAEAQKAERIDLVFSIPTTSKKLSLQIADGTPISVPAEKKVPSAQAKQ